MMSGIVNAALEPLLKLTVRDDVGQPHDVESIDTGFNGFLTLPPAIIAKLRLPWLCRQQGELADGSVLEFDVYVATVDWKGRPRSVEVEAADAQPLLGMALMQGLELRIQIVPGGALTIAELTLSE
jgi:clan AA aspartic protease